MNERPLRMLIPARLRPHIRASFCAQLGYSEQQAVIYLLQNALERDMANDTVAKLRRDLEALKSSHAR